MVMIGIDPHKRSHTAVALSRNADVLGTRMVPARNGQVAELVAWADGLDDPCRTWAIESAGGLGYLLAQQLLAAGESVIDIPAVLASRVRVLSSGKSNKNDPNDAYSVALAALHTRSPIVVRVEDHATILRLLSRRHTQLARSFNKTACRLHALMCELVPGELNKQVVVAQASALLDQVEINSAVTAERVRVARDMVADLAWVNEQRRRSLARIHDAVQASGTTLTEIFGVGDVVAATLIGHTANPARFANADRFAAYNLETTLQPARPATVLNTGTSDEPLPDPPKTLRRSTSPDQGSAQRAFEHLNKALDTQREIEDRLRAIAPP